MADYQLIVIGAGPGGYTAALRAAKLGLHTAVIEDRECGGTCLNRGCVPTKALLHASQVWSDAHHCAGVCADGASLDLPALYRHKDEISQTLSSGIEGLFRSAKVTLLRGRARITAPGCVEITGQDAGTVTADHILIATGSVPARPPIPGLELAMTSDELLKGTDRLYRSIVIMGGGVIGVEFEAQLLSDPLGFWAVKDKLRRLLSISRIIQRKVDDLYEFESIFARLSIRDLVSKEESVLWNSRLGEYFWKLSQRQITEGAVSASLNSLKKSAFYYDEAMNRAQAMQLYERLSMELMSIMQYRDAVKVLAGCVIL